MCFNNFILNVLVGDISKFKPKESSSTGAIFCPVNSWPVNRELPCWLRTPI